MTESSSSANKALVSAFSQMAFVEKRVREAAELYLPEDYIQHHPEVADRREAFIAAVSGMFERAPDIQRDVKRVVAEDDLVVVHSHLRMIGDEPELAIVDFFRVDGGKIVEHWEVDQPLPEHSANDNTMF